jgi:UDP-glucose 4-epimerase
MRALSCDDQVSSITGVARRLPSIELPKTSWVAADISIDSLRFVEGADVVVHLAWMIQPQRDERALVRTNIDGSRRVVDAVLRHDVPALIYASSVGAYSPGPKTVPVDESWPVDGIATSVYSRQKAFVEAMLDEVVRENPSLRLVRMRTSLVFQAAAASEIHRLFLGPLIPWHLPRVLRFIPRCDRLAFQATHAADIADAYRRAVTNDVSGPFNIAAEPILTSALMARAVGGKTAPVPATVLRGAMSAAYRLRLLRAEPGWLDMALGTPFMDSGRARAVLGWSPTRTSVEAFQELLAGIGSGSGLATEPLAPKRRRPLGCSPNLRL